MITGEMIKWLACPACFSEELVLREETVDSEHPGIETGVLECAACRAVFEIDRGVPNLVPEDALVGDEWNVWVEHLGGYGARQQDYIDQPSDNQAVRWREKLRAFSGFIDPQPGRLLDIGCGTGSLRNGVRVDGVTYVGIDPLPTPHVREFNFARAIAEALPFQSNTFSSVVIRSALDHFCELERLFAEVKRVMATGGHLYVEQAIHDWREPRELPKFIAHEVKDLLDDWRKPGQKSDAPKHMNEFTRQKLLETLGGEFEILRTEEYSRNWYTPTQVFVALRA